MHKAIHTTVLATPAPRTMKPAGRHHDRCRRPSHPLAGILFMTVVLGSTLQANVTNLRCEYMVDPLGIDALRPRLSWQLESNARGEKQLSAQIIVASTRENAEAGMGDLWSTTINSDRSFQVEYSGTPLRSEMECFWRVKVTGITRGYAWSDIARWSTGLLDNQDWAGAQWIGADAPENSPSPMLRKSFVLNKPVRRATVYATAHGVYELHVNGRTVGDQILAPGWTDYRKRVQYQTYDITTMLDASGENVLGGIIGDGWYNARLQGWPSRAANGSNGRKLLVKLSVEHTDGTATTIVSDESWSMWTDGPVRFADLYIGETCDSRKMYLATDQLAVETLDNTDPSISYTGGWTNINSKLGSEWYLSTARSCRTEGDYCQFTHDNCTQLRYFATRAPDEGMADVYLDGQFSQTIDLYHPARTESVPLYDSGPLTQGPHTIRVVVRSQKNPSSSDYWVECDKIEVTALRARTDIRRWDQPGFAATGWTAPKTYAVNGATIEAQCCEPIRVDQEIRPVSMTQPAAGVYIFDMGQNMVGWCRLTLDGPAGTQVVVRHGEMLNPDGSLYTANLRSAAQRDVFILNGNGEQVYEPRFTYHGFRYVEVSGLARTPSTDMIVGRVFRSDAPLTGSFACSSPLLNQIWTNTLWGQRGNFVSVPTDCPQRDERMGWMGDAQIFAQTAMFNMDLAAFFSKWTRDMRDGQSPAGAFQDISPTFDANDPAPAWADAGVIVPWTMYQNYGDIRLLGEHFDAVQRYVDKVHSTNTGGLWLNNRGSDFGDWLDGSAVIAGGYPAGGAIPREVFATAFYYNSTVLCAKMAAVLGDSILAQTYHQRAQNIKAAFNDAYVNPTTGVVSGNSQSGYALALNFNLLPDHLRAAAARNLNSVIVNTYDTRISSGFNTTLRLMMELSREGYNATAYALAESRRLPSWGYSIDQGATTIWERWDGWVAGRGFQDAGMNSFNHYSFGSVCEWFYRVILGINFDEGQPGYKHFSIHPQPGGSLTFARGSYRSISGLIRSAWRSAPDSSFFLEVTVPANTTADICIPKRGYTSQWIIREGGQLCWEHGAFTDGVAGITAASDNGDHIRLSVGGGEYAFRAGDANVVGLRPRFPAVLTLGFVRYDPASGTTRLRYTISGSQTAGLVTVRIYDLSGQLVAQPVQALQPCGTYTALWRGTGQGGRRVADGSYVVRLQVGESPSVVKRIIMVRQ